MIDINKAIQSLDWNKEPRGLYEPIEYTLASGGKRLRPALTLIAAELIVNGGLINGDAIEHAVPAALALEIFHNFTLLHDDVMDRAEVRRGRPTVHIQWNDNTAILSGDQMLIEAYKHLSQVPTDKLPQVLRWFNEMATAICEGQQYDVDFEHQSQVSIEDYMMMIEKKTSVLIANALRTGGYIAGATPAQQEASTVISHLSYKAAFSKRTLLTTQMSVQKPTNSNSMLQSNSSSISTKFCKSIEPKVGL